MFWEHIMFFLGWFFKSFSSKSFSVLPYSVMSLTSHPWQFPRAAPTFPRCLDGQVGPSWFRLLTQNIPVEANRSDLLSSLKGSDPVPSPFPSMETLRVSSCLSCQVLLTLWEFHVFENSSLWSFFLDNGKQMNKLIGEDRCWQTERQKSRQPHFLRKQGWKMNTLPRGFGSSDLGTVAQSYL